MRLCSLIVVLLVVVVSHGLRLGSWRRQQVSSSLLYASVEQDVVTTASEIKVSAPPSTRRITSSGAAMEISDVVLSIGNNDIISDINWTIMPLERWGLVGKNGAGKSTLLRALTGTGGEMVTLSQGVIGIAKGKRMGYLEQKGVDGSTSTVRTEVSSRMDRLTAATTALSKAEEAVSAGDTSDEALVALEEANVEFEAAGGYTVEQKISNVLKGLGFVEEDWERKCSEFSGGWKMRIALARLLLSEPDLLILDEPTNHLDKGARDWLGDYLSRYDGTLLVVSHDIGLLESAVSSIAEVRGGTVELYKSRSHSQWLVERDERVRDAQVKFEANQREIARLQTFVDRFGAKTMGASMAQSRLKTIEKLEETGPQAPIVSEGPLPVLKLPPPPRGSEQLLELKDCVLAWPAKKGEASSAKATAPIINECNVSIQRGMRIAVRGPNGAGKSTVLSALSGKLQPLKGTRIEGDGLELGVFTQDLAQDLDQEALAVDVVTSNVRQYDPTISDEKARSVLGALGLMQEKAVRKVGHLSGGEKARVALASFVLIPHNLLLLDEPSNHLDQSTLKVLTTGLRNFAGSVLVISHDREFLEKLEPTHILTVRGGRAWMEERNLREEDWNDPLDSRAEAKFADDAVVEKKAANVAQKVQDAVAIKKQGKVLSDEERKAVQNAPRRVPKIETQLAKLDEEKKSIDEEMMSNGRNSAKLQELQKKKDLLEAKSSKLLAELEFLMDFL